MWKLSFSLFIILTSSIGSMLFWQWNAYSEQNDIPNKDLVEKGQQVLTVEAKVNHLQVTQYIKGLTSGKEYRITVPESISEWSCIQTDGNNCDSKDENPSSFIAEDGGITIALDIPINQKQSSFLINDWMVQLPDVEITDTSIKIIDTVRREGTWITGLPLKGHSELELIDYYVFAGKEDTTSLFWHSTPLFVNNDQESVVYYLKEEKKGAVPSFESLQKISQFPNLTVIFTDQYSETNGKHLMIVPSNIQLEVLERKMIYQYFLTKATHVQLEERWIYDVLTSLWIEKESYVPKGNKLIADLKKNLTNEELTQFLMQVIDEPNLTFQRLDDLLGNLKGKGTHFFTLNKNETTSLVPMYFVDPRKIIIKEQVQKGIEVVYYEENKLFPFMDTMKLLGYDVKALSDQETLLLNKGNNDYRFYMNENIFIYNDEDYGLLENPLIVLNGKVYMESEWIKNLFKVSIEETEDQIKLSLIE